jgi:hypothetical protein
MTKLKLMHKLTFAPCNVRCCSSISHVLQTAYEKSDMGKKYYIRALLRSLFATEYGRTNTKFPMTRTVRIPIATDMPV